MNIHNSSPAAEEKMKAATNKFSTIVSTNQPITKFFCLVSISLLLSGCSAIAAIPIPLRIISNLHTVITVARNTDDNPDNDSRVITYLTEKLPERDDTNITDSNTALINRL